MANNPNGLKPLPKTIFNEFRMSLKGPIQEKAGGTREPGLRVSVIKNNPRIDVFTGIPNDKDSGVIKAPMDSLTFHSLLSMIDEVIDGEDDTVYKIINYTGAPHDKRVISTTYVGKDKSGVIWLSLTAEGRPKIKFKILPTDYHHFCDKEGNPLDPRKVSHFAAKAWVRQFRQLVPNVMTNYYEEPDYNRNKQYNNSGYGTNSNPNQGYNKNDFNKKEPDIEEDDLKF